MLQDLYSEGKAEGNKKEADEKAVHKCNMKILTFVFNWVNGIILCRIKPYQSDIAVADVNPCESR